MYIYIYIQIARKIAQILHFLSIEGEERISIAALTSELHPSHGCERLLPGFLLGDLL